VAPAATTVRSAGWTTISGAEYTRSAAPRDIVDPTLLAATARYRLPSRAGPTLAMISIPVVVPLWSGPSERSVHDAPLPVETCQR
jgi:hypothetical protein